MTEILQTETVLAKAARLEGYLRSFDFLIVAYSGGVDSSLLAYYARAVLKSKAKIVIAVSPSLSAYELEDARAQAKAFQFELCEILTNEIELAQYRANVGNRCFFCKATLFEYLGQIKNELAVENPQSKIATVYGANLDDLSDLRPGHKAAEEAGVLAPLIEAQLSKAEIRWLAQRAGLPSANRPQAACLSSRFPINTPVSESRLRLVEAAEASLRSLGFKQIRVRYSLERTEIETPTKQEHSPVARIELGKDELSALPSEGELFQDKIVPTLKALGFAKVTLSEHGYVQGGADKTATSK